jgi:hypothetical protein
MTCCMSKKMRVLLLEVWQKDAIWLWGQTVALCKASVAMAIADVFRNNGISVGSNSARILKIFEKIDEAKN